MSIILLSEPSFKTRRLITDILKSHNFQVLVINHVNDLAQFHGENNSLTGAIININDKYNQNNHQTNLLQDMQSLKIAPILVHAKEYSALKPYKSQENPLHWLPSPFSGSALMNQVFISLTKPMLHYSH